MNLKEFFKEHDKVAIAYSGGVDSAFLLYAGIKYNADIVPFYVDTPFQPEFERRDALNFAKSLGVTPIIIKVDVLRNDNIVKNPPNRCYYCKKVIMSVIKSEAFKLGYDTVIDGTNFSDDFGDRPGMKLLFEEGILSPLRICSLSKEDIRQLSKEAGLATWDKPAYSCLATRIKSGESIDSEKLFKVEKSEEFLFSLGFSDFRVRTYDNNALLQFRVCELPLAYSLEGAITSEISKYFDNVTIDSKGRT